MGVSGSGKTTVGGLLARRLGWPFFDADNFHPPANVEKMRQGVPLTDEDRLPWLERLGELIAGCLSRNENAVLACSALKESYRGALSGGDPRVRFVHLRADPDLLATRLERRTGHFFTRSLLESQLASLEEPEDALVIDASAPPEEIVRNIQERLRLK
ncbi:MAG TPA: gluconokinase [Thermoanaerobaculia bacterium]|nr:gluconokinase [Thermoanaerobaculia bacterium]